MLNWLGRAVILTAVAGGIGLVSCRPAAVAVTPARSVTLPPQAHTAADAQFMRGMIMHHAQALVMAAWAPTHGAREDVSILAARIDVSQRDEIAFMKQWLTDHREMVPDESASHNMQGHDMSAMGGMGAAGTSGNAPLMPGMLTTAQLSQLSAARGAEFDRLFLTFMIQHHEGAMTMASKLFATPGAGQEELVFRFATDVMSDQSTEIARMKSMLSQQPTQ